MYMQAFLLKMKCRLKPAKDSGCKPGYAGSFASSHMHHIALPFKSPYAHLRFFFIFLKGWLHMFRNECDHNLGNAKFCPECERGQENINVVHKNNTGSLVIKGYGRDVNDEIRIKLLF